MESLLKNAVLQRVFAACVTSYAFLLFALPAEAAIIPPDRLPLPGTWESAGVEGGIPNRATIFADVTQPPYNADKTGATSAVSAIQNAINACPRGHVVYVPPGRYRIDGRIRIQKSITLRGAGSATVFNSVTGNPIQIGGLGPWPAPKNNPPYTMPVTGGATRGSKTLTVADASLIPVGRMIQVSELDDPSLVWAKSGFTGRLRASMHMVESKTTTTVTFRPALPIDYARSPMLARFPDLIENAGVENIKFIGAGTTPADFIEIISAWNVWVKGCEFTNMPSKTVMVAWSGHVELRQNYVHDQSNGGPNSEGLDFLTDVNWSLVVDNICVAGGFPCIVLGDSGAGANYSGGFGNVIAYNYVVDSFYTDPPTSSNHGIMAADVGTNHSPHNQYTLVEGNYINKFLSDAYHGSGSHTVLLRNVITGRNRWSHADNRIAVQIDRRNLYYSLVGNVVGEVGNPATHEYLIATPSSNQSALYRLGFPDVGNQGFSGTYPPTPIPHRDGGPRDLYVGRNNTTCGTTLIEGDWNSVRGTQDWTIPPAPIPASLFLPAKPAWFGSLAWPPVDPANPVTDDPTIIPAGYRYIHGTIGSVAIPPEVSIRVSQVEVCWKSSTNRMYQVQYRSTLTTNIWTNLGAPVQGTGVECVTDAIVPSQPQRFYQVAELP
jgi:hypothetical protein